MLDKNGIQNLNYRAHWLPFSANRNFHQDPRIIVAAKGAHLIDQHGREIYDSLSGLWTTGIGHCIPEITQAVSLSEIKTSGSYVK